MMGESKGGLKYHPKQKNWTTILQANQRQDHSLYPLLKKIFSCSMAMFAAHQLISQILPRDKRLEAEKSKRIINRVGKAMRAGMRGLEESIILFWCKITVDSYAYHQDLIYSEYEKGALTGFVSYLLARPLSQVVALQQSFAGRGKNIGRAEAIALIHCLDGLRGFYKFQNLLGPFNSLLYRSIQFGLWRQLATVYDHFLNVFLVVPLVATGAATIATLYLQKCRNLYINLHYERQARILSHDSRIIIFSKSISREVLERPQEIFRITRFQAIALAHSLYKNWLLLAAFIASQHWDEIIIVAEKSFSQDLGVSKH